MKVSYRGFNDNVITMVADPQLKKGDLVVVSPEGRACKCAEGEILCGYAVNVSDGFAAVQLTGYIEAKSDGAVKPGYKKLAVDGDGKVYEDAQGREVLVLCSDEEAAGFII